MKLLSPQSSNTKTAKGTDLPVFSAILHLAPSVISGYNTCPKASEGCAAACLYSAGRGKFSNVQHARIRKTKLFFEAKGVFFEQLHKDLKALVRKANKLGKQPAVRLNGTSDLNWSIGKLMSEYPEIQFYDYTKNLAYVRRLVRQQAKGVNTNYHLTFSRSESNEHECIEALALDVNVAVVFSGELPNKYLASPVISGETHDFRFLDGVQKGGLIIGLTAKGAARVDRSGFVVPS